MAKQWPQSKTIKHQSETLKEPRDGMRNLQALVLLSLGWTLIRRHQTFIISKPLALLCNPICCIGAAQYNRRVVTFDDRVKSFWLGRSDCSQTLWLPQVFREKEFTAHVKKYISSRLIVLLTRSNKTKLKQTNITFWPHVLKSNRTVHIANAAIRCWALWRLKMTSGHNIVSNVIQSLSACTRFSGHTGALSWMPLRSTQSSLCIASNVKRKITHWNIALVLESSLLHKYPSLLGWVYIMCWVYPLNIPTVLCIYFISSRQGVFCNVFA